MLTLDVRLEKIPMGTIRIKISATVGFIPASVQTGGTSLHLRRGCIGGRELGSAARATANLLVVILQSTINAYLLA
jgi:hypothetical protein